MRGVILVKKYTWLIIILLLTGCSKKYNYDTNTVNYNLNINETFNETIIFTYSNDIYEKVEKESKNDDITYESLEYSLLNKKIEPIFSYHNVFYDKKIKKTGDKVNITLKYNYLEDEYRYSQNIMQCFEKYEINSEEDYFELLLSGEFYCYNNMQYNINIQTNYNVLESNGFLDNNKYTWNIDNNNYKNINIKFKISRDYDEMETEHLNSINVGTIFVDIMKIILIISLFIIIYILKKREKKLNE